MAVIALIMIAGSTTPAVQASSSQQPTKTATQLPWGVAHLGLQALTAATAPARFALTSALTPLSEVPVISTVAKPAHVLLNAAEAMLPVGIAATGILDSFGDIPETWIKDTSTQDRYAWQLPAIPTQALEQIPQLTADLSDLTPQLMKAADCDCLPTDLTQTLGDWAAESARISASMTNLQPLLPHYNTLTGGDEPQRFLLVIGNQAEMRASGGAPLYLALISTHDGTIEILDKGATSTHFFPPDNRPITWMGLNQNPYYTDNPRTLPFVNANYHPDFSISAQEMAAAFQAGGFDAIDGVIATDLTTMSRILDLTGPIDVPGIGAVSSDSLIDAILVNAYADATTRDDHQQRQTNNDALVDTFLTTSLTQLSPLTMLETINDSTEGRNIQVWMRDTPIQQAFDDMNWTGRLAPPSQGDWLAWFTQSGNPSKTDIRQERTAVRSVTKTADGFNITTTYTITNTNQPNTDPNLDDRRGYHATWMRTATAIYLPPQAQEIRIKELSGVEQVPFPSPNPDPALRFAGWIPPQGSATITIDYFLPHRSPQNTNSASYQLTLEPQLNHTPYRATVELEQPGSPATRQSLDVTKQTTLNIPLPER